jgi:hypothetical protein
MANEKSNLNKNDDLNALLLAATKAVDDAKPAKVCVITENTTKLVVEVEGLVIVAVILAIGLVLAFNPTVLTAGLL